MCLTIKDVKIVAIVILCFIFVTSSTFGVLILATGHISIFESFGILMCLTLASNYSINMGAGYQQSHFLTRSEKIQDPYTQRGFSILKSAFLILGLCGICSFSNFTIFHIFGFVLFLTIVFSVFASMLLFPAVAHLIGPEDEEF